MSKEEMIQKLKKNLANMQVRIQLTQCSELKKRLRLGAEATKKELEQLGAKI